MKSLKYILHQIPYELFSPLTQLTDLLSPLGKTTANSFHAGSKSGCSHFTSSTSTASSVVLYLNSKVEILAGGGLIPSSSYQVVVYTLPFDDPFDGKISTAR